MCTENVDGTVYFSEITILKRLSKGALNWSVVLSIRVCWKLENWLFDMPYSNYYDRVMGSSLI